MHGTFHIPMLYLSENNIIYMYCSPSPRKPMVCIFISVYGTPPENIRNNIAIIIFLLCFMHVFCHLRAAYSLSFQI